MNAVEDRSEQIAVRVSKRERALFEALAKHHGLDVSGTVRMAVLKMVREEGIALNEEKPPPPKR